MTTSPHDEVPAPDLAVPLKQARRFAVDARSARQLSARERLVPVLAQATFASIKNGTRLCARPL